MGQMKLRTPTKSVVESCFFFKRLGFEGGGLEAMV
jgi:hypothetical protein